MTTEFINCHYRLIKQEIFICWRETLDLFLVDHYVYLTNEVLVKSTTPFTVTTGGPKVRLYVNRLETAVSTGCYR